MTGALAARIAWTVLGVVLVGLSLTGLRVAGRFNRKPPSTAKHRPDPDRTVMFRVPPEIRPGRHVGRAQVQAAVSDLEVETRGIRYLPPNAVVMSRWPKRLQRRPR